MIDTNKQEKEIRCAIYTRKSTTEGLEQEFSSLDAQRESCSSYIASQRHEGWVESEKLYDDGGFTGGNMERPAQKQLLDDINAGLIDCIVVYKVDRLSRSLMDFLNIMNMLDKTGVSFVSVIQEAILNLEPTTDHVPRFREREVRTIAILPNWEKQRVLWKRLANRTS